MTCIVGIADEKGVWIGGDSASCRGYETRPTQLSKVFKVTTTARETFLIGYTSSFRMGQLLQYRLDLTTPCNGDPLRYLVTTFIEGVRSLFKDAGYATVNNSQESGGSFLMGFRGQLYKVDDDYQVNHMVDGYDATGCGEDYALGALAALEKLKPEERLRKALEIAAHFSGKVCAPFVVEHLLNDE